ncbi:CaiB/BaiF CoA transferase family protein [Celeribacter litoreus]|uniref:CaiB/BaiF CoA transferase family protein n=1 Tax=Celeribacter litoreus TaxID=2876714 RepID=UPI001CCD3B27|nr:CaiB/BaiF CoA-transferase family protein [Celeribacter litoreus]MCA0043414.1 CoA transferase [Celeribacter litoreus]
MKGALDGIRVLDFSTLLPGPMATLILAEAGAEVIKVERPGRGEEMRSYVPKWGGSDSSNFHLLNRGKKSIAVDLKDPKSRAKLTPLIESADIVMEQFRPGVMARLGLSYDDMRAINPDIIYCSITGYGQTGPKAMVAGHDLNYQGDAGMAALSLGTPEVPVMPPALTADIAGGTYPALVNILMALWRREKTGEGAQIDIAMAENLFPFLYWAQGEGQVTGDWPGNGDALVTGGTPRYRLYPTSDGRFAAIAPIEQKFWEGFCAAIDLDPALRDDAKDPAATTARVAEILASKPASHWAPIFEAADCCCSIVNGLDEAMSDPHFRARGVFDHQITGPDGSQMPALPVPVAPAFRAATDEARSAPALGADNAACLGSTD